ncbi:MAG TPA: outer membrane protein assembly factor BamA [Xanthobacteraceae bacterium]|jgi:outer membrane protein insertion porin family
MVSENRTFRPQPKLLFAAVLAVALAGLLTCPAAAADLITVEGNRRVDTDAIKAHFRLHSNAGSETVALDAALKELYATGEFEDVRIIHAGGRLIVRVVEAPAIGRLQFEGNRLIKDADLAKATRLERNAPLTKAAVKADVARIVELYQRQGRYAAQVTPKTIARGEGRVDLVLEINEGAKTGVKRIVFAGNRALSENRLKAVIKTSESGWLGFLKTSDIYDPDRVAADAELVKKLYGKHGFADAQVTSAVGSYDPTLKGIILRFTIDEGERYTIRRVDIESHIPAVSGAELRGLVRIAAGEPFNADAVENARREVVTALGKRGYPFASVRPRLSRDMSASAMDVALILDDGPHRYVERIVIRGNLRTRDDLIRAELELAEGDPYNQTLVDRSERRLRAMGLFKSVIMSIRQGSAADRLVLAVDVEEQKTGEWNAAGGYSAAEGVVGEVTVSEMNFLGRGQFVKVSATLGQYVRGGALSVVDPYLLGNHVSVGGDLFYRETLTNSYQSYGSTSWGGDVKIGAPLTDNVSAGLRYSLVSQSMSLAPGLLDCVPPACVAASAAVKQAALNGPTLTSAIGPTLTYSTLDNPRRPSDGLRADFNQTTAGLGGTADFLRSTAELRAYKRMGDDVVASTHLQTGTITPFGGQSVPLLNSFFGGPQLVRGFAPNGFGPRDLTPGTTMDNIGGSSYWATSAQLEAPIPGLPPGTGLKGAFFADAGSLWGYRGQSAFPALSQSFTPADSRRIRSSIGASLIWDSPLGPLHVDYAFPTSKTNYDVTQRLGFGAGAF